MRATITRNVPIVRSGKVMQLEGLFDIAPSHQSEVTWDIELPLEQREWSVGAIVGPSGSGKTSLASTLWPEQMARSFAWPDDHSLLDGFPKDLMTGAIVRLLIACGTTTDHWLRPFSTLSTGEQFRVTLARVLAEATPDHPAVMDEYTSAVDRTVAQDCSHAVEDTVRHDQLQFVAVTCHDDVLDWLQPDWTYRPDSAEFAWSDERATINWFAPYLRHTERMVSIAV